MSEEDLVFFKEKVSKIVQDQRSIHLKINVLKEKKQEISFEHFVQIFR